MFDHLLLSVNYCPGIYLAEYLLAMTYVQWRGKAAETLPTNSIFPALTWQRRNADVSCTCQGLLWPTSLLSWWGQASLRSSLLQTNVSFWTFLASSYNRSRSPPPIIPVKKKRASTLVTVVVNIKWYGYIRGEKAVWSGPLIIFLMHKNFCKRSFY